MKEDVSLFRLLRTVRRSFVTEEPYWFWNVGEWEVSAGFFQGVALGVGIRRGEWDVAVGPFAVGGVRRG